jgi:hypothetical protein
MADREQPYDPYIPSQANPAAHTSPGVQPSPGMQGTGTQDGSNNRTAALQAVSPPFHCCVTDLWVATGSGWQQA